MVEIKSFWKLGMETVRKLSCHAGKIIFHKTCLAVINATVSMAVALTDNAMS